MFSVSLPCLLPFLLPKHGYKLSIFSARCKTICLLELVKQRPYVCGREFETAGKECVCFPYSPARQIKECLHAGTLTSQSATGISKGLCFWLDSAVFLFLALCFWGIKTTLGGGCALHLLSESSAALPTCMFRQRNNLAQTTSRACSVCACFVCACFVPRRNPCAKTAMPEPLKPLRYAVPARPEERAKKHI